MLSLRWKCDDADYGCWKWCCCCGRFTALNVKQFSFRFYRIIDLSFGLNHFAPYTHSHAHYSQTMNCVISNDWRDWKWNDDKNVRVPPIRVRGTTESLVATISHWGVYSRASRQQDPNRSWESFSLISHDTAVTMQERKTPDDTFQRNANLLVFQFNLIWCDKI